MTEDHQVSPLLTIPVSMVGLAVSNFVIGQVAAAASSNISLVVTMSYQQDPWYAWTLSSSFIFIQTIFCIWFGVTCIIAIVKLLLFIKEQGFSLGSVPQICLIFTVFCSLFYAVSITLNVLGSRNNTSQLSMVVLRELVFTLWIMPAMVFPFYWGELVASTKPVSGLKEAQIPFYVAIFIIEGFTLAVAVVKGLYGSNPDVIRAQVGTITILAGLAGVYFTIQGIRIIFALSKMQDSLGRTPVQRRTTFLFICLGILLFGFTADFACGFSAYLGIMFPNFACYYLFYFVFAALALAVIVGALVPSALKKVKVSAILSGTSVSRARSMVGKESKDEIDVQMNETKITI